MRLFIEKLHGPNIHANGYTIVHAFPQSNRLDSALHVFTHLLGVDKLCSGAKTRIGIGYNGDGGDDDGKREESLGNHFVCSWMFYFVMEVCCCVQLLSCGK